MSFPTPAAYHPELNAAPFARRSAAPAAAELGEWELVVQAAALLFEAGGGAWAAARLLVEDLLGDPAAAALPDVALARALGRTHAGRVRHLHSVGADPVGERGTADRLAWLRERRQALQALGGPGAPSRRSDDGPPPPLVGRTAARAWRRRAAAAPATAA